MRRSAAGALLLLVPLVAAALLLRAEFVHDDGSAGSAGAASDDGVGEGGSAGARQGDPRELAELRTRAEAREKHVAETRSAGGAMRSAGVVSGSVRLWDGTPVRGATVRWWFRQGAPEERGPGGPTFDESGILSQPAGTAVVGDDGRFRFDVAAGQGWVLVATAEGCSIGRDSGMGAGVASVRLDRVGSTVLRVVSAESGAPVQGAAVHELVEAFTLVAARTLHTNAGGCVALSERSYGSFLVLAPGFAGRRGRVPWETTDEIVLELDRAAEVAGVVTDADGRPVPGARVSCPDAVTDGWITLVRTTDERGAFRFEVPDDGGPVRLIARPDGSPPAECEARPGDTTVRIVLANGAWIEGVAVDRRDQPLAEFEVTDGRVLGGGRFERGPLEAGIHEVEVHARVEGAPVSGRTTVTLRAGERRQDVRVVVSEPMLFAEVRAVLTDPSGAPVAGVSVQWDEERSTRTVTDEEGRALLRVPAPPGTRGRLAATPVASQPWLPGPPADAVLAKRAPEQPVRVTAYPAQRVLDPEGEPIPSGSWTFDAEPAAARAEGELLYVARGVRLRVTVHAEGRAAWATDISGDLADSGLVTVRLPTGPVVRGRVVFVDGAQPDGLRVAASVRGVSGTSPAVGTPVSADGSFTIPGLPDGRGSLYVTDPRGRLECLEFTLGGADVDLGEIPVRALAKLTGTVVDDRGAPVPRASVRLVARPRVLRRTDAAEDGSFEIDAPEGTRLLATAGRGEDLVSAPVDVVASRGAAPVTLRLERAARVLVRAPFAGSDDVAAFVRPASGGEEWDVQRATLSGDEQAFSLRVPPGAWALRVTHDGREWTRKVTVGPGDVSEVTLEE